MDLPFFLNQTIERYYIVLNFWGQRSIWPTRCSHAFLDWQGGTARPRQIKHFKSPNHNDPMTRWALPSLRQAKSITRTKQTPSKLQWKLWRREERDGKGQSPGSTHLVLHKAERIVSTGESSLYDWLVCI